MDVESNLKHICLNIINEIENNEEIKTIGGFSKEVEVFKERLNDDEIRIAVVGEFSSGKSTFINALIGRDILNHATKETTAVITRLVNTKEDSSRYNTGEVVFKDGTIKKLNDLGSLKEYTSTFSITCDVVNQIKNVSIYVPIVDSDEQIVLIDTPGLNGIADGHREQTIELIKNAHFCIYLLQRKGLSNTDIEFLNYIKQYQNNFIVIQNFIDTFNKIEGEYVEDKLKEQEKILREKIFKESGFIYCLCGVSAWQELVSRDDNIKKYSDSSLNDLTKEDRECYHHISGFNEYRKTMNEIFDKSSIEKIKFESTAYAIDIWLKRIEQILNIRRNDAQSIYELCKEDNAYKKVDKLINKIKLNSEKVKRNLENFVLSECRGIRKKEEKNFEEYLIKIKEDIGEKINDFCDIDQLDEYHKNIPKILDYELIKLQDLLKDDCDLYITNLYQMIVLRVEEYSGISYEDVELKEYSVELEKEDIKKYEPLKNKIEKLEEEKSEIIKEKNRKKIFIDKLGEDEKKKRERDKILKIEKERYNLDKEIEIKKLGKEPSIEIEYKVREVERSGVLGWLGNKILGKKKEYYTEENTTKRDEWRKKKRNIESKYNQLITKLEYEKEAQERQLKRLKAKIEVSEQYLKQITNQMRSIENEIKLNKELLEKEKQYAKLELLNKNKNIIKKSINKYLFKGEDNINQKFKDNIDKIFKKLNDDLIVQAIDLYDNSVDKKLNQLEKNKEMKESKGLENLRNIDEIINKIQGLKQKLEEYM